MEFNDDIREIIARYYVSAIIDGKEQLCHTDNIEEEAIKKYEEYFDWFTLKYNVDEHHIVIILHDYDLGIDIKKYDSIEDNV